MELRIRVVVQKDAREEDDGMVRGNLLPGMSNAPPIWEAGRHGSGIGDSNPC